MDSYSTHSGRIYMDDRAYRSAPITSHGYDELAMTSHTPRYSPGLYSDRDQMNYADQALDAGFDRRSRSAYGQDFYGYDTDCRWGSDEIVRRTNREVAIANSAVNRLSGNVQIHPMMTLDGRYPPSFSVPRRLADLVHMDSRELDSIMSAYELGSNRRRYYRGSLADRFGRDDPFNKSQVGRRRDLIALFEFLAVYPIVEHLAMGTFR
ncbi:hypothetical protein LTR53_004628 [Teratosphaeriaceae sp. CCFEE 6253]|nr:hypothetical protein LTR53_004628 [Teratosphaeriaceae sp. CCFEE 6253]